MKLLMIFFSLTSMMWAMAVDIKGEASTLEKKSLVVIQKIEGKAKVLSKKSIKKHKAVQGETLYEGDILITYNETKVMVKLQDCSYLILNAGSELSFISASKLKQVSGEVYYKIKTRQASQGLKIETPFSIMGIKGTEFIVDTKGRGQIALNEGLVGIASLHADFELHKQNVMAEYEKFKEEQKSGFEGYKAEAEGKVISYTKAFDLNAGKVLNFSQAQHCEEDCESRVDERDISDELSRRFEMYADMID